MTISSYKVSLCGEPEVGKTSIALRQAQNSFPNEHQPTLGANFLIWETIIDGKEIRLIIADSGSQERFLPILPKYFQGSDVAVLVFDITNKESFTKLDYWYDVLQNSIGNIPIIIVGNKLDLEETRSVTKQEAEEFAKAKGTQYFEVSAKEKTNLFQLFKELALLAIEKKNKN
ncbi:MAG: Rab family GTPase [Candidatus Heimdallarchaeaceae archaeon]